MGRQIAILSCLTIFFVSTSPVLAEDPLVPSQYPTIWAAIDAAESGDESTVVMGYHYPIINNVSVDIDGDGDVDLEDFAILGSQWRKEPGLPSADIAPLVGDGIVDMCDLKLLVENWLWGIDPNRILGHWKLDEGGGTTAYDSAGFNDGTLVGDTSWTMGLINGALLFDGDGDYVFLAENAVTSTEFTVTAWANHYGPGGGENNRNMILCQRDDEMGDNRCAIEFATEGSYDNAVATIRSSSGSMQALSYAKKDYNQWHHYAMTVDSNDFIFYIDGVDVNRTSNNQAGDYVTSIDYIEIGRQRYTGVNNGFFNGVIDDVRVYKKALSAEEIRQLYEEGLIYKATNPSPGDETLYVDPNTVLSWTPGYYATSHDVYLGADYNDVNDANTGSADYKGNYHIDYYDPCGLNFKTTYYWRVDEVNDLNIWKGDVWSFTTWTEPNLNPTTWWKFDEINGTIAHDSVGNNDGNLIGDTSWTTGQIYGALLFDGDGDYISLAENAVTTTEFTIAAWANHYGRGGGDLANDHQNIIFQQRDDTAANEHCAILFGTENADYYAFASIRSSSGSSQSLKYPSKDYNQWHHYAMTVDSNDFILYIDGIEVARTSNEQTGDYVTSIDYIDIGRNRYVGANRGFFNGVIDDVRVYDRALHIGEIEQLYREEFVRKAIYPNPSDEASDVDPNIALSWTPGYYAVSHDVYLGTDYNDVNDANRSSTEYMGNFDINSFNPNDLELETTYYWRVDEVNNLNIWQGDVWSFTTWTEFDPNTDLVSWWKLDEGSGSIAYDSAGGNNGTLVGDTSWTAGQIDGALLFDGNGDYVFLAENAVTSTEFTVTAWANHYGPGGGENNRNIIFCQRDDAMGDNRCAIEFATEGSYENAVATIRSSSGSTQTLSYAKKDYNQWHHYAMTVDSNDFIFYINGVEVNRTSNNQAGDYITSIDYVDIGRQRYSGNNNGFFNGAIDDIRTYDRALSAGEILQLYQYGLY